MLTVESAQQAGQVAAAITQLQDLIAMVQTVISEGDQITSMVVATSGGPGRHLIYPGPPIDAASSAVLLNAFINYVNSQIAALTAQLAAIR